ncbi:uncharacterized protein BX664DRAFT_319280 [Halteromyces radiatus]|uniref:uncharacterized protein n=1 Tax=Halteromyces radiatus TaxID=101107 RepID=UPI0022207797|nr:uncharacterized protein BX664DRAFT_319280 [Halteromyces radiatus]KAI8098655.1 hypothetical protein BX664DRAFT_319280 [Halteromyces radiatus]
MANASSKKIAAANTKTLSNLQIGFASVNIVYILWRVIYLWGSFSKSLGFLYILTTGLTLLFYSILKSSGTPTYNIDGTLRSSGDDLNSEGLTAYMFDIIYITWFVHISTAFISNKFWYTYLVIPGYALYKGLPLVMKYFGSTGGNGNESNEANTSGKSKRQQKMEKRGGKVKYVR